MEFGVLRKWSLAFKIIPILIAVVILKLAFHYKEWEFLSLSPLFTSILAATVFLLGFLISGVLSDYKESEKLPGELVASLEAMHDEATVAARKTATGKGFLKTHLRLIGSVKDWLYEKEKVQTILKGLARMNDHFIEMEKDGIATARMKAEQATLRKIIIRMDVIRETSFVQTAYAIVEALIFFLIAGMILVRIEPFYESMFFVVLVAFLMLYMIFLIRDLDNPFEYRNHGEGGSEVSLKPLHDLESRLKEERRKG